MRTIEQILTDYRGTLEAVTQEAKSREKIMETEAYKFLEAQLEQIQESQNALLIHIPDSREESSMDEKELIAYMQENNIFEAGEFRAKTRAKRSVDTYAVLQAMDGDIDNLMLVSSVKQKDLEEFIKANPGYKKDLRFCIKDEGFTITSLVKVS